MSEMSGASASERPAAWERGAESPPDGISSARTAAVVATSLLLLTKARLEADVKETMGAVDRACAASGSATAMRRGRLLNFIGRRLSSLTALAVCGLLC